MGQDPVARRPLATFEVETVAMADGRTIRFYTWPEPPGERPEAADAPEPTAATEEPGDV